MRKERNRTIRAIDEEVAKEEQRKLDEMMEEIENSAQDSTKMFKAIRALHKSSSTPTPKVLDKNGKITSDPDKILQITTDFYKDKFYNKDHGIIDPFTAPLDLFSPPSPSKKLRPL